jgi:hypothetical protein
MPGNLVQQGASVLCAHGGQAQPTMPSPRIRLSGSPAVVATPPWTVAGCALPTNVGGPCVTATWVVSTVRVTSMKQPLVVSTGSAVCTPTATPLTVVVEQVRVSAT